MYLYIYLKKLKATSIWNCLHPSMYLITDCHINGYNLKLLFFVFLYCVLIFLTILISFVLCTTDKQLYRSS